MKTSTALLKIKSVKNFIAAFVLLASFNTVNAADLWKDLSSNSINERASIQTTQHRLLSISLSEMNMQLSNAAKKFSGVSTITMKLPLPNGKFENFYVYESSIMEAPLAAKYPNIRTYAVQSVNNPNIAGRIDISHKGFHAILFTEEGSVYIDPLNANTIDVVKSYYKKHFVASNTKTSGSTCKVINEDGEMAKRISSLVKKGVSRPTGNELRTYRLAVGATGEYTAFHGGTVPDALSSIVTTINRVVGVYEREVAIRMILVGQNDTIIFTNPATDPFDNNSTGTLIEQSQTVCDSYIGSANYDVGHTFSTGAGGLAQLGVPCTSSKARGVTGINNPINDPFDIDYVAHELGHQFGAGHTFNGSSGSCSGNLGSQAYEPGSGTTIMAYAGICSPQNVQNNSDDYFHGASYDQITAYSILSSGNNCAIITNTGNTPPKVGTLQGGYTIPKSTPFELTGNATDADNDALTYQWEQFDLGPQGAPNSPVGNAPLFRSFKSTTSPTRVFPQISDIVNNTSTMGEILPSYARGLTMRFNAKDNRPGGGGVDHDFISLTVDDAGPFLVTVPNTAATYEVNEQVNVTWDVANTNTMPINCQSVNIYLSTDGGFTYPITLLAGTPNNGSAMVTIPNELTTTARIKVKAADNVFFDISNTNFTIIEPSTADFFVDIPVNILSICSPTDAVYNIEVEQLASFSSTVNLSITNPPAGVTIDFSSNDFVPTAASILTVGNTAALANGTYNLDLQVTGNGITRNSNLSLEVFNAVPTAVTLMAPIDEAEETGLQQNFVWESEIATLIYDFELSTDIGFTDIIGTYSGPSNTFNFETLLTPDRTYYWRVKGNNTCGTGAFSEIFTFTTDELSCNTYAAGDLPKGIATFPISVTSTVGVSDNFLIADVNVLNLTGEHTWIADLDATLTGPDGTEVVLFSSPCNDEDDWNINFDDAAASATLPCPLTDGNTYQPKESLSNFYGKSAAGNWTLTIRDNFNGDGGEFSSWSLQVCQLANNVVPAPNAPSDLTANATSASEILLTWTDNATDEVGFEIQRSLSSSSGFTQIATVGVDVDSYNDMGLNSNTVYYYKVKALATSSSSNFSNEASDTTFNVLAASASNLVASATSISTIDVTWNDNSDNELGFILDRSTGDNSNYSTIDTVVANTVSYTDIDLNSGTTYYYKVAAYNEIGNSAFSNEDSALTHLETAVIDIELDNSTTIYPNPTNDYLFVSIQQNVVNDLILTIYDAAGKNLINKSYNKSGFEFSDKIDVRQLPSGLYILKIQLGDAITYRKIQKN